MLTKINIDMTNLSSIAYKMITYLAEGRKEGSKEGRRLSPAKAASLNRPQAQTNWEMTD